MLPYRRSEVLLSISVAKVRTCVSKAATLFTSCANAAFISAGSAEKTTGEDDWRLEAGTVFTSSFSPPYTRAVLPDCMQWLPLAFVHGPHPSVS
jgi:hypothetical protein